MLSKITSCCLYSALTCRLTFAVRGSDAELTALDWQMIVKSGDDCRQEHLAVQLVSHFHGEYRCQLFFMAGEAECINVRSYSPESGPTPFYDIL